MRGKQIRIGLVCLLLPFMGQAATAEPVTPEQAQRLFLDKTFDGHNEVRNEAFRAYSAADGTHIMIRQDGVIVTGKWRIDERGRHCITFHREECSEVKADPGGAFQEISDGRLKATLRNFVPGDQL